MRVCYIDSLVPGCITWLQKILCFAQASSSKHSKPRETNLQSGCTSTPPVLWKMPKCCCIILSKQWVQVRVPDARKRPGGMSAVEAANSSWQSHTPTREAPKDAPRSRARPPACKPRQPCWTHCLIAAVCQLMRESLSEVPV